MPRVMLMRWKVLLVFLLVLVLVSSAALGQGVSSEADLAVKTFDEAYRLILEQHLHPPTPAELVREAYSALRSHGYMIAENLSGQISRDLELIHALIRQALTRTSGRITPQRAAHIAIMGMVSALNDRYSAFYPRIELGEGPVDRSYGGIGVVLSFDRPQPRVIQVFDGSPADQAGIQPGDVILAIDGIPTDQMDPQEVVQRLRGAPGTAVRLRVGRRAQIWEVTIVRAVITPQVASSRMLTESIGYIALPEFEEGAGEEISRLAQRLASKGASGMILDLRGNPGGILEEAVKVASVFIQQGVVTTLVDARNTRKSYMATKEVFKFAGNVVVLVDGGSASASELVAGALQDAGFPIVGTRTLGKGTVQVIRRLPDGSGLKLTVARFLTPRGREVDGVGIRPDVVVTTPPETIGTELDRQIQEAIRILRGRLKVSLLVA